MAAQTSALAGQLTVEKAGSVRFTADRRQLGGIMLLLGVCATIEPLTDTHFTGDAGFEDRAPIELASFVAGLAQVVFGSVAVVVGFLNLVHDYGNQKLSTALLILVQAAWVPFVTRIYKVVEQTSSPYDIQTFESISGGEVVSEGYVSNPFIPAEYLPTVRDVRAVGSFGVLGELAYMVAFYGALAFTAFAIYSFDTGKPTTRDARFYRGRLLFYSFVVVVAGLSQLLLGAYFMFEFGSGPLHPVINVAMYTCYYPEINIAVGLLQMLIGYYGIARYFGLVPVGPHNHHFQVAILLQWISTLAMQYVVQTSLSLEGGPPTRLPEMVLLGVGLNVLPAFLDYKMRTTPYSISKEYYGLEGDLESLKNPEKAGLEEDLGSLKDSEKERFDRHPVLKKSSSERRKKSKSQSRKQDKDQMMNGNQHRGNELHPPMSRDFLGDAPTIKNSLEKDNPIALDRYAVGDQEQEEKIDDDGVELAEEGDFHDEAQQRASDATQLVSNRGAQFESLWNELDGENGSHEMGDVNDERLESAEKQTRDPPGVSQAQLQPNFDEDSETPDDSTEVLEGKLEEIERELYTDSMESFRQSLTEIL